MEYYEGKELSILKTIEINEGSTCKLNKKNGGRK